MATDDLTRSQREALKAIHRLRSTHGAGTHTGDLAIALGRSAPTISAVVKQLAELGLVDHRPYRGIGLTSHGEAAAVAALRRHRIVERFLSDLLGFHADDVRQLATSFEHALPADVEERLDAALNRPETCPHGSPISRTRSQRFAVKTNVDIERREATC